MKRKRLNRKSEYGTLENRRCMAVVVGTNDGHMWVEGEADGVVEIYASGEDAFTVTDNGVEIGTYEDVSKNLRVRLDQNGAAQDDVVNIDVLDEAFENISVQLGDGDNHVSVEGSRGRGWGAEFYVQRIRIQGGQGNDSAPVSYTHLTLPTKA